MMALLVRAGRSRSSVRWGVGAMNRNASESSSISMASSRTALMVVDEDDNEPATAFHDIADDFDILEKQGCHMTTSACAAVLRDCGHAKALSEIKRVHDHIVKTDRAQHHTLNKVLVEVYGKCGSLEGAKAVFSSAEKQDGAVWTSMIRVFSDNGHYSEALKLFREMIQLGRRPRRETYLFALSACAGMEALAEGKFVHSCIASCGWDYHWDIINKLISTYSKCGSLSDARRVFDEAFLTNSATWNAIISAYAQAGHPDEVLNLFWQLDPAGDIHPHRETYHVALAACSRLEDAKAVHACVASSGYDSDSCTADALFKLYIRIGSLQDARAIFDSLEHKDLACWESMIGSYAENGYVRHVLELYQRMSLGGVKFSESTLLQVVDQCQSMEVATAEDKEAAAGNL